MAEEKLVEKKIDAGEKLIEDLRARKFDISAAFWMQEDGGLWYLYLASKAADDAGVFDAYKKMNSLLRQLNMPPIDPFEIKIIGANDPLAVEVLDLQREFPVDVYSQHRLRKLGGLRAGEAHIYPLTPAP